MRPNPRRPRYPSGFSLGEMLAVVIVGSLILTAVLTVYGRASRAADAVLRKIDRSSWAAEVLQRIAQDLDRTWNAGDVAIQIRNGPDNGFQRAELVLRRTYHDHENKEQVLEEITWRAGFDSEGNTRGLMLYRSYEGVAREDKLFDAERADWERGYLFVPICRGVTFFKIQACQGNDLIDQWPMSPPPPGVRITISFGQPYELVRGGFDVADSDKVSRIVAIDPTRAITFHLPGTPDANGVADPNSPSQDGSAARSPLSDGSSPREQPANERVTNEPTPAQTRRR